MLESLQLVGLTLYRSRPGYFSVIRLYQYLVHKPGMVVVELCVTSQFH